MKSIKKMILRVYIVLKDFRNIILYGIYYNLINYKRFSNSKSEIQRLQSKHSREKCYIIGNGPSLTINDYKLIQDEITFGANFIHKINDGDDLKLNYYFVTDSVLIHSEALSNRFLHSEDSETKVVIPYNVIRSRVMRNIPNNILFFKLILPPLHPSKRNHSYNMLNGLHDGFSVVYFMIQAAIYMGFEKIVLLGVDNSIAYYNHFYDAQLDKDKLINNDVVELSFRHIHNNLPSNVNIFNATRGGFLEVFPRVDLSETLKNGWYG